MTEKLFFTAADCADPYRNLAREELLMKAVQPGECILYLWQNRQTVVVGRNQNCWRECRVDTLEADGGLLARRLSGGGAVYHDLGNLNFTFLACRDTYDVTRQLSVIAGACRRLGIPTEVSGRNDLTAGDRKFSGNAFYRAGEQHCHHGTLLLDVDTERMNRYLRVSREKLAGKGVPSVQARVVNLCTLCPGLTVEQMREALLVSFGEVYGAVVEPFPSARLDEQALTERTGFFGSGRWRYGSPLLRSARLMVSKRFVWGGFNLYAEVREGRLHEVCAFSDAMDCDFISRLPQALEGVRYDAQSLAEAVRAAGRTGGAELAEDIAAALVKSFGTA